MHVTSLRISTSVTGNIKQQKISLHQSKGGRKKMQKKKKQDQWKAHIFGTNNDIIA